MMETWSYCQRCSTSFLFWVVLVAIGSSWNQAWDWKSSSSSTCYHHHHHQPRLWVLSPADSHGLLDDVHAVFQLFKWGASKRDRVLMVIMITATATMMMMIDNHHHVFQRCDKNLVDDSRQNLLCCWLRFPERTSPEIIQMTAASNLIEKRWIFNPIL